MKTKKAYFLILAATLSVFCIIGCGKDETITNPPPSGGGAFTLSGTIINYPGGSLIARAKITKLLPPDSFFVGTDTIDNNGVLSMSLVTPPTDYLGPIIVPSGITISDTTAKISGFAELTAYNFSSVWIGRIEKRNFNDSAVQGSFAVQYIYLTKAVSITGSDTNTNLNDTTVVVYNLNPVSGWNALSFQLTVQRPNYRQYTYSSGELAGATWRYSAVPGPLIFGRIYLRVK